jgi:hypothetical protein
MLAILPLLFACKLLFLIDLDLVSGIFLRLPLPFFFVPPHSSSLPSSAFYPLLPTTTMPFMS